MNDNYDGMNIVSKIYAVCCVVSFGIGFYQVLHNTYRFEVCLIISFVFGALGFVFRTIYIKHKKRVKRLNETGLCYDCEIVKVYENKYKHTNYYNRCVLSFECVYTDKQDNKYTIMKKGIWFDNPFIKKNEFKAKIWVNPDNARDYYVEVYTV